MGQVTATDPGADTLTYRITGGSGERVFAIDDQGRISVQTEAALDFESNPLFTLDVQVRDDDGATDIAALTISLLNRPSIDGTVFVDVNANGLYEANEPGIDGVTVELLKPDGAGGWVTETTAVTSAGGYYLFEDLFSDTYRVHEVQPSGVDDGPEILGSPGGTVLAGDTMELTLARVDATDYVFAEFGRQLTRGETAAAGFWQNKHGQALIKLGGAPLAQWLTDNFGNVFGNVFLVGDYAAAGGVADFFKEQLFREKGGKSAGLAKVDARFMAVAFATFFTSRNLAGDVAAVYGFNVTDTGIGTKIVNVGGNGAAFGVADGTDLTIQQLLLATNSLTDSDTESPGQVAGFASIYDRNGDGLIDTAEAELRAMANEVYALISESGGIV